MVILTTPLLTHSGVNDIFIAEDRYALVATEQGVDIIDLFNQQVLSSGILPNEPLCVVADTDFSVGGGKIYIGTTSSGIFSANYIQARQPNTDFSSALGQEFSTLTVPALTSDQINDLAVQPARLLVSTNNGVDFITNGTLRAFRTVTSGSNACQMTSVGEAYWTVVNSGIEANYDLFPTSGTGTIPVDFEYNSLTSTPTVSGNVVRDISIVEGSPNLLAFGTSQGATVVEEVQGSEASSTTKAPNSVDVISLSLSSTATLNSGFLYTAVSDTLTVFDLSIDAISGTHTVSEGTRTQTLATGTLTVIRTTNVA